LRYVIFGGEALDVQSLRPWFEQHGDESPRLVNMYGITETTVHVTYRALTAEDAEGGRGSVIGEAIPDLSVYVLDAGMRPVPEGVCGEFYVGGAGLARGYLGRPRLTAQRFVPDPFSGKAGGRLYRTGDVGRMLRGGGLEYVGRADNQVKIRGFRIELGEVEAALSSHPGVRECAVVAREEAGGGRRLVAYVAGRGEAGVGELRSHLKGRLPEYMVPQAFVVLDALPLTENGKVDRRALPEPEGRVADVGRYVAPRTAAEELVAGVWAEVLGVGRVGVEENFFELGGHSLLATQVASRVRDVFGVEVPLRAIFERPTVAGLAEAVEARGASAGAGEESGRGGEIRRRGREAGALSFSQQRLWFLDQLEPGSALYNIPAALRLSGELKVEALERALTEIVRRHEILRANFRTKDGEPELFVGEAWAVSLPVSDLSGLPEDEREAEMRRLASENARRPFSLNEDALLRAALVRLDEDEHVILLTMHHIISDGWSVGVLVREVAALYEAYAEGKESPLEELPIQYSDYAAWQRRWPEGATLERQLTYWREKLAGAPEALDLPTDRPRPPVQSYRGATEHFALPAELSEALRRLSRREGVTLFMTLLAAFEVLLARYSGQTDVSVGTPVAGRTRPEVEGLIGFFVNTLVMRGDLSGDPSFRELLARTRETALEAFMH
ncbi:MAG TPA: condensation domain-containing protein, partial [Pyrinomonadaceae bacterium]|nr:condensation domain-containing protein [Pyrinomonadaceae bacterium]